MQTSHIDALDSNDDASFPTELPAIVQVHFADIAAPLVTSSNLSAPSSIAEAPLFLSRYLSEPSRWTDMQNAAFAKMVDPSCPRGMLAVATPSAAAELTPPIVLRVRGPHQLRVRLERSLQSQHVGTLQPGAAFAFSHVGDGWAKLSPMHFSDLSHSKERCNVADFKPHNLEESGYCITEADGTSTLEQPRHDQKAAVLARFRAFFSGWHLEHWQGPLAGLDLSRFDSEGIVKFNGHFSTARGPAYHRSKGFGGYEIEVLTKGPAPQFGFCTPNFARRDAGNGEGCGDDRESWAWDGVRHVCWTNGEAGKRPVSTLSWTTGDIITFECDFSRNLTSVLVNGRKMDEYAFSPQLNTLYAAITSRDDEYRVNFGSRPFRFLRQPPLGCADPASAAASATRWEWPCSQPPSLIYSDGDECVNMTVYVKLSAPLLQRSDPQLLWARFLRCALYFAYATSAPPQRSKRALLLQATSRVGAWAEALASKESSASPHKSDGGFDEDVQQLLGADFVPPKNLAEMAAEDIAGRVAADARLSHFKTMLKGSLVTGQMVMQASAEELHELLLDAETAFVNKIFEESDRCLVLERLLSLKSGTADASAITSQESLKFDSVAQMHVTSSVETVFRSLRSLFPQDSSVFDLDLAAMCQWPDFSERRWQEAEVVVPFSGVMCVGGASFVYTEEFSTFFPREICSNFNVIKAWVLPAFQNTPSHNLLLSQLSTAIKIPSLKSAARNKCAVVVVLSGLSESSLDAGIACKLLPALRPEMPLSLTRCMLDQYQLLFFPETGANDSVINAAARESSGTSNLSLIDDAAKAALLIALKRLLDPSTYLKRRPIFKRVAKLLLCCAKSMPMDVFRCGLLESMLKFPVHAACAHSQMLLSAISAVAACVCVLPETPSDPRDIVNLIAPNNWPEIINNFIADLHKAGHDTFSKIVCSFLCGRSRFAESCGSLHPGIVESLYTALSAHFRAYHASSRVYYDCILRCCATGFNPQFYEIAAIPQVNFQPGDYSSKHLTILARFIIRLLLSGRFQFSYISPCTAFLQSCAKSQELTEELESLYTAIGVILGAVIPALDPRNNQPLHICMLHRAACEVATSFNGLEFSQISADGVVVEDVVSSLGWCEVENDDDQQTDSAVRLPLVSGALLDALKCRHDSCATVAELSAATNLPFSTVHACMQGLVDQGFVQSENRSSGQAVFRMVESLPHSAEGAAKFEVECFHTLPGPSPISIDRVDAYIQICSMIMKRVISHSNSSNDLPVAEAQLIATISSSEYVPCADVASVIYFLIARNILKRVMLGNTSFVGLSRASAVDPIDLCRVALAGSSSFDFPGLPSLKFRSSGMFQKIVVFVISDVEHPQSPFGNESVLARCMLSLNPSSCIQLGQKSSAEDLITRTINQLCRSTGMTFVLAAKELMNAHGFPERVLIKCIDSALYSSMFSDDVASAPEVGGQSELSNDKCFVCYSTDSLIQLPCNHCICEDCFECRFLSDKTQHVYGALPEDQTPSSVAVEDGPRPADYFSCPFCKVPLDWQFWSDFPDRVKQSQREKPESKQVTLEHVHRKIVLNTLRTLRRDPLAALARCEPQKVSQLPGPQSSSCYVACIDVLQSVKCLGRAYDSICDLKSDDAQQNAGLHASLEQQWRVLSAKINENSQSSEGAASEETDLKPQFVSDSERPQNEAGRLMDFRMCPVCFFGNIVNTACASMGTHHGEQNTINACSQCGFFSSTWSDWPKSDDRLKNQSFRIKLPFLKAAARAIAVLDSALECITLQSPSRQTIETFSTSPSKQLLGSLLGRQIVRDDIAHMRRVVMSAAIKNANSAQNVALKELSAEEKHATLLFLLLHLKDGFVKPHVEKCFILEKAGGIHSIVYSVHATLLCRCAIKNWPSDTLDKFLIGDLGTSGSASSAIKNMLDAVARKIEVSPGLGAVLDPDVPAQNALANHIFQFEGWPAHHVTLYRRIVAELQGNFFFESLSNKNSLACSSIAHFLLRHIPFSMLIALITSNGTTSICSLLLHALGATKHSFLNAPSSKQRRSSDIGAFALAAADHLLRIRPLSLPHPCFFTAYLNHSRKIEVIADASASRPAPPAEASTDSPVHVSLDLQGNMYICGANKRCIRVLDKDGRFKCDLSIQNGDGSPLRVEFLRATTVDWTSGNIYVTDRDTDSLHCITPAGRLIDSVPDGVFKKPRSLSICPRSRRLAVADYENHQVVILDPNLSVLAVLKGPSSTDKFQNPIDTAFDANGFLYIMDSRNNRVVVMNDALMHLMSFGSKGKSDGLFENPTGIFIDGRGKVFVNSDARTQMFDRTGNHIATFTSASLNSTVGWGDVYGITADHDGRLLICSQMTNAMVRIL